MCPPERTEIRSEERKPAQGMARRIVLWQLGLDALAEAEIDELRADWEEMLLPALTDGEKDALWEKIEEGVVR